MVIFRALQAQKYSTKLWPTAMHGDAPHHATVFTLAGSASVVFRPFFISLPKMCRHAFRTRTQSCQQPFQLDWAPFKGRPLYNSWRLNSKLFSSFLPAYLRGELMSILSKWRHHNLVLDNIGSCLFPMQFQGLSQGTHSNRRHFQGNETCPREARLLTAPSSWRHRHGGSVTVTGTL